MQYLWIDLETTGKDFEKCSICEIACFITGDDFVEKNVFHEIIIQPEAYWQQRALEMHLQSGLISDMHSDRARPEEDVIESFKNYLEKYKDDDELYHFAGSSVHFDKNFLDLKWNSNIMDYFSHRVLDVSSIKLALRSLIGDKKTFEFDETPEGMRVSEHRALDDIRYSAKLFKFYRDKGYIGSLGI